MQKGLRRDFLVALADAYRASARFKSVQNESIGANFPSSLVLPAVFISKSTEQHEYETNCSKVNHMLVDVVVAVNAPKDVDLVKADVTDDAEEVVISMLFNTVLREYMTLVSVVTVDASPTALFELGIQQVVLPPYGIVRLKVQVDFPYTLA